MWGLINKLNEREKKNTTGSSRCIHVIVVNDTTGVEPRKTRLKKIKYQRMDE
jgi:hypothetical protein